MRDKQLIFLADSIAKMSKLLSNFVKEQEVLIKSNISDLSLSEKLLYFKKISKSSSSSTDRLTKVAYRKYLV